MGGAQDEDGDQGDVDLDFHGVFADAEEVFDFEVLLDPFEEQLDLPALFVERGDLFGRGLEVVGDEPQGLVPIDAYRDLAQWTGEGVVTAAADAFGDMADAVGQDIGSGRDRPLGGVAKLGTALRYQF